MIVARAFSTTADTALVNNVVNMAAANRKRYSATILRSDHGSAFTSWSFGENVRRWGLLASFAPSATVCDKLAMESFWARLQVELLNTRKWRPPLELAAAMADCIDNFYNTERRHSYLGDISPQSSKRSGHQCIQSLSSHNHDSKPRGQINWTTTTGSPRPPRWGNG